MDEFIILQAVSAGKSLKWVLWEFIISHWEWFTGILVTCGTFLMFQTKRLIKWIKEMNLLKQTIPELQSNILSMNSKLDTLVAEFTTNGGGTLKDQTNRIERKIALVQNIAWSEKENSEDGFFITNEHGEWTKCNKAFLSLVGAQEPDCLGDGWIGYISYHEREKAMDEYNSAINQKRSADFPCSFKRDIIGSSWKVNIYLQPMKNDGKIIGFTGTIKKI